LKAKYNKGFTLVEVMVALAVVAIVSTSLFQMFVTTSYVNKDAQVMDLANIVAVKQAETFKALTADPVVGTSTKYYDSKGAPGDIPTGAVIQVDSAVTSTDLGADSTGYFPSFVGAMDLSANLDWDVQITTIPPIPPATTTTYRIDIGSHGGVLTTLASTDSSKVKNNVLPIKVSFTSGSQTSRTIHLINNSAVEVDIYFFTPVSDPSLPAEQSVTLTPVSGYSSLTSVKQTTSKNTKYHLELTVSKVMGNVFMLTYSTDKYFYH